MPSTLNETPFLFPFQVTLIKPQAPETTFGIRHSIYTTPLIVE